MSHRDTCSIWISFTGINKYGKFAVVLPWTVFWPVCHVTCQRVLWNETFLEIYLTTFYEVPKFKNWFKVWASSLFWKCSKLNPNLGNAERKMEYDVFPFWDNWIWKCCNKLPLLGGEHILSAVNGLTNSHEIFHITQRDFFNLNCLHRDQ